MNHVGAAFGGGIDGHDHLATCGKFDGIGDEVDKNLAQAVPVSDDYFGNRREDVIGKFQALLMGAESQPLHDVSEQVVKVELEAIKFQASRFYLGEIQDLVDDQEQGFGGELRGGEIFALLRREVGFQSELGHTDDAVQGRADLVTHIGKERALGAASRISALALRQALLN